MKFGKQLGGGRRVAQRFSAGLQGVAASTTKTRGVFLINISATGARVQGEDLPARGEAVVLKLGAQSIFAEVCWSDPPLSGLRFDEELTSAQLAMLRREANVALQSGLSPEEIGAMQDWRTGLAR